MDKINKVIVSIQYIKSCYCERCNFINLQVKKGIIPEIPIFDLSTLTMPSNEMDIFLDTWLNYEKYATATAEI